jgi:NitT/TauT family transport system substrate-binding protein
MKRWLLLVGVLAVGCGGGSGGIGAVSCGGGGSGGAALEVRIPKGAGGVGFLPLLVMEKRQLVEKHAREGGLAGLQVRWIDLGGPAVLNDALLSGAVDFIAAGPPAFLTLWDRTNGSLGVKGVAAIASLPMYLNTNAPHLKSLNDVRAGDKIAVTGIKVSIPSLVMQMYARQKYGDAETARFDRYTVAMTHPDGVIALLSGGAGITAHFTSPPFHQRELKDPNIRTIMRSDEVMGGSTTFTMLSTTTRFREENPAAYKAVLSALEEANRLIVADIPAAAALLAEAGEGGFTAPELAEMLRDPAILFTTTPENVMKYAEFMNSIGSIKTRPAAWTELFFPEIHAVPGS